jgi:hypothetical protein
MNIERIFELSGITVELYEAAYDPMVTKLKSNFPDHANDIDGYIKQAKAILKKQDRMVWYIKVLTAFYSGNIKNISGSYNFKNIETFNNEFFHYYGFNINEIETIQLLNQNISEILDTFETLQKQYQKSDKHPVPIQHGDYELIKFPDGTAWWFVDRAFCDEEGRSGNHCGNVVGQEKTKQRILSLRTKTNNVILTFILEPNRFLGEMKAKSNQKPSEKYHPQIMSLLLNPIVKGIKGAGYAPEMNFSIFDLSEQNIQMLVSHHKESFISDQIKAEPSEFMKAPDYIKNNVIYQSIAIKKMSGLKFLIGNENDLNAWEKAIKKNGILILYAPTSLPDVEKRIYTYLSSNTNDFIRAPKNIKNNFKIVNSLIYHDSTASFLSNVSPNTPNYEELCITALSKPNKLSKALQYIPENKRSFAIYETAVRFNPHILYTFLKVFKISDKFSKQELYDLCKLAVNIEPYTMRHVPEEFQERIKQELNIKESFNIERMLKLAGIYV